MAEVWEGRDEVLSRPVAVKILMAHLASDPFLRERFRREAVTAARLVHPGIVAIFDAGVEVRGEDGNSVGEPITGPWSPEEARSAEAYWPDEPSTAFIIMELVLGETLRDLIARSGPLPADLGVAITAQVTEALAYAHAQGLVHRDIKPANVLLGTEGSDLVRVKVADFGIAKATATAHLDLTASGTLLGTPKYLSPEQVQGQEPDARADLYSLGVVLYEMLAGQAPFKGSTEMATALAHVQQPPPSLERARPGLPPALYDLVNALLVKDPAHRVPSALVLGGALASVRKALGLPAGDAGSYIRLKGAAAGPGPAPGGGLGPDSGEVGRHDQSPLGGGPPGGGGGTDLGGARTANISAGPATEVAPLPMSAAERAAARREARARRRRFTGRTASIVVGVLLLAGGLLVWQLVMTGRQTGGGHHHGGGTTPASGPSTSAPTTGARLAITSVHELAQNGNSPNDNLPLLRDVVTGTGPVWTSAIYKGPNFGNYGGLGLVFQLDGQHTLHQLAVATSMRGWSAQVYVSNSDPAVLAHNAASDWGPAASSGSGLNGDHAFSLGGRKGSWVLFWMLNPGQGDQAVVQHVTIG